MIQSAAAPEGARYERQAICTLLLLRAHDYLLAQSDDVRRATRLAIIWLLDHEREAGNAAEGWMHSHEKL